MLQLHPYRNCINMHSRVCQPNPVHLTFVRVPLPLSQLLDLSGGLQVAKELLSMTGNTDIASRLAAADTPALSAAHYSQLSSSVQVGRDRGKGICRRIRGTWAWLDNGGQGRLVVPAWVQACILMHYHAAVHGLGHSSPSVHELRGCHHLSSV